MILLSFTMYLLFVCLAYIFFRTHRTVHKILKLEDLNTIPSQLLVFMLAVIWPFIIVFGYIFFILYGLITILEFIVSFIKGTKNE